MPAFQADTLAGTIIQFRKFIHQVLHENKNLYKLQKHRKCNFVQSPDNEAAKRPWDSQNQLPRLAIDNKNTNFNNNKQKYQTQSIFISFTSRVQTSSYNETKLIDLHHAMLMPCIHDFRLITRISCFFEVKGFIYYAIQSWVRFYMTAFLCDTQRLF